MSDSNIYATLEAIVTDFIVNGKPFTAFDVTTVARNNGNKINHWEVKGDIHKIASNTNYIRTPIYINGNEALLYHPVGADISSYLAKVNTQTPIVQISNAPTVDPVAKVVNSIFSIIAPGQIVPTDKATPVAQSKPAQAIVVKPIDGKLQPVTVGNSITQTTQSNVSNAKNYGPDKRGRLWIPSDLVAKIGANIASKVNVSVVNNKVEVSVQANPSATFKTSYTVDRSQNIAISENVFEAAGIKNGKYKISQNGSKLIVEKA